MIAKILSSIFAFLLLLSPLCAQGPTGAPGVPNPGEPAPLASTSKAEGIELPDDMTVNNDEGFVNIQATCKGTVKWLVIAGVKVKYITNDPNNSIIISIPPQGGVITVFAVGLVSGKMTDFVRTNITINGNNPGPNPPGPNPPGPNPNPGPVAGPLHVTFVLDLNNVTPELAQLLNSQTLRKGITDRGCFVRIYDSKSPIVAQKKLDALASRVGGPAMIIQKNDGTLAIAPMAIPRTEAEILGLVTRMTGGN